MRKGCIRAFICLRHVLCNKLGQRFGEALQKACGGPNLTESLTWFDPQSDAQLCFKNVWKSPYSKQRRSKELFFWCMPCNHSAVLLNMWTCIISKRSVCRMPKAVSMTFPMIPIRKGKKYWGKAGNILYAVKTWSSAAGNANHMSCGP